jgi:hypothetical protein
VPEAGTVSGVADAGTSKVSARFFISFISIFTVSGTILTTLTFAGNPEGTVKGTS